MWLMSWDFPVSLPAPTVDNAVWSPHPRALTWPLPFRDGGSGHLDSHLDTEEMLLIFNGCCVQRGAGAFHALLPPTLYPSTSPSTPSQNTCLGYGH